MTGRSHIRTQKLGMGLSVAAQCLPLSYRELKSAQWHYRGKKAQLYAKFL